VPLFETIISGKPTTEAFSVTKYLLVIIFAYLVNHKRLIPKKPKATFVANKDDVSIQAMVSLKATQITIRIKPACNGICPDFTTGWTSLNGQAQREIKAGLVSF